MSAKLSSHRLSGLQLPTGDRTGLALPRHSARPHAAPRETGGAGDPPTRHGHQLEEGRHQAWPGREPAAGAARPDSLRRTAPAPQQALPPPSGYSPPGAAAPSPHGPAAVRAVPPGLSRVSLPPRN